MFSWIKKSKNSSDGSNAIFHCVKMLLIYRLKRDKVFQSKLIANNGHPEIFEVALNNISQHDLSSTAEYYVVYLIAIFITIQRIHAGKQCSLKDIIYTIDQNLPKPRGYVPVEMWSPANYSEYIMFRLSIDMEEKLYPKFVIDDLYEKICSHLKERGEDVHLYIKNHPI